MRKIKDVLRLKFDAGLSHERIAASLGISKGVVAKYIGLAAAAGLDWPTIAALDETGLQRRLLAAPVRASGFVLPEYGRIHQELRRKGMTLMLLWEEHVAQHPDEATHRYSQFCENYRRFARQLKRSMRQTHRAGEKLFIDFAGPTVGLMDGSRAHIFVAALGASGYTFACATPREGMVDWLGSTARALAFLGGVPQLIVPDNPRALIANPNCYEPRANETVEDFARHYGTSVLPARPYHPQDKAKVESAVQVVERWILMRLRHQNFAGIDDVNEAIAPLLERLNAKAFQNCPAAAPAPSPSWTRRRCRLCRCSPGSLPCTTPCGCTLTTTSSLKATATACPRRWSARCWRRGSRPARSNCSIAASAWPVICAAPAKEPSPRWPSTCRQRTARIWSGRPSG